MNLIWRKDVMFLVTGISVISKCEKFAEFLPSLVTILTELLLFFFNDLNQTETKYF